MKGSTKLQDVAEQLEALNGISRQLDAYESHYFHDFSSRYATQASQTIQRLWADPDHHYGGYGEGKPQQRDDTDVTSLHRSPNPWHVRATHLRLAYGSAAAEEYRAALELHESRRRARESGSSRPHSAATRSTTRTRGADEIRMRVGAIKPRVTHKFLPDVMAQPEGTQPENELVELNIRAFMNFLPSYMATRE